MLRIALFLLSLLLTLGACTTEPEGPRAALLQTQIIDLAQAIRALGPGVDPEEAERAARVAVTYPLQLRAEYGVTDPPLIHNTKVNMGLRPRGLCWHWAEDLERRLKQEDFRTLDLHRAIANADRVMRIDHSSVVVTAKGGAMEEGIVLDGWRHGGHLFWTRVPEDADYHWERQRVVLDRRR